MMLECELAMLDDPIEDVLLQSRLHKVMVTFHAPANWPTARVCLAGLCLASLAALPWLWLSDREAALIVLALQLLFLVGDAAVLIALPRRNISFGPWTSLIFSLTVPRVLATAVLSLAGRWWGVGVGTAVVALAQVAGTAAFAWGSLIEPFRLSLTKYRLYSDRLPDNAPPIRILHISDLHVERLTRREEAVLRLAAEAAADLILITGDYVNLSYNQDPNHPGTGAPASQPLERASWRLRYAGQPARRFTRDGFAHFR